MRIVSRHVAAALLAVSLAFGVVDLTSASGTAPDATIDESAVALNDVAKTDGEKLTAQKKNVKSPDEIVEELIYAYMDKHGIQLGYNADKDKSFAMGVRIVSANTASPDFGKFRANAFDLAYTAALNEFVKSQSVSVTTQALHSLFNDTSTRAREFEEELSSGKSTVGALLDKVVAVGDAIASNKLREFGIDPDKYNAAPPDQKKTLLEDGYRRVIRQSAFKTMGGMVPVQTFIGNDGNGNESVGVLLMFSPKLEAIAAALRRGQTPAITKKGPPLKELLPLDEPEKLYDLLGVRVLFDENGVVIVSYGQWANSYTGNNPQIRSRQRSTAFSHAESSANAQLVEFFNTSFNSDTFTQAGETLENSIVKDGRTNQVRETDPTAEAVGMFTEIAKRNASMTLRGSSTLKRWSYTTPEGHSIVGVIKTYSMANMEAVARQEAASAAAVSGAGTDSGKKAAPAGGPASGRTGTEQMDINTF